MGVLDDYNRLKRKRLGLTDDEEEMKNGSKTVNKSAGRTVNKSSGDSMLDEYNRLKEERIAQEEEEEDIAPFLPSVRVPTKTEDERTWFQPGAFEDGYQFGDITKTILGTTTDLRENVYKGVVGLAESAIDVGAYAIGEVGGWFGAKDFQSDMEAFIEKDLIDEEKWAKAADYGTGGAIQQLILNGLGSKVEDSSVLGDKSDSLAQSGGQLLTTAALQGVGVPWYVTSGVYSFGSTAEEALKSGASYDEAGLSAVISTASEILTEKLFGGSGLGEKGLINLEPLTKSISSKLVKTIADYGIDMGAEGVEEVVSQFASNLGSSLYKEENIGDILFSEEAVDGYIESFVGGMALGGTMNVGNVSDSIKSGKDYRTGLTETEQKVFDKVFEDRIAEESENGEVTNKRKKEIREEILNEMEKGYLSTDTIEEVLAGDSYKAYKDNVANEEALRKEYDELYNMKNGDKSSAQVDREAELKKMLEEIDNGTTRSDLRSKLNDEVFGIIKGSRLANSYIESDNRTKAFTADLTKYDEKMRPTVQKAIDSGILNNTNRTREFVDMVAKISADKGVSFDFINNKKLKESIFAVDGKQVNAYVTKDGITLNINSAKALNTVVGHEITHVLEGTEFYNELQSALFEYAKSKNDYQGRYDSISQLYKDIKDADFNAELTADLVGDYLFTDSDFIHNLSTNHRNLFQKIYDEIKYLCKVATAGSKEARQLEKVKHAFENAYRAEGKAKTETKYSVSVTDEDTLDFLDNQETITTYKTMQLVDGKLYPPMAARTEGKYEDASVLGKWEQATEHPELIKDGNKFKLDKGKGQGSIEAAYNPYMHSSNLVLNDQFSGAYARTNLVTVECEVPVSELTSGYHAQYAKDSVGWHAWHTGTVAGNLRKSKGIERQVFLSRWIKPVRIVPDSEVAAMYKELLDGTDVEVPDNVVTPALLSELKKAGVKIKESGRVKYSISDSDGNQLTEEQQEYFKDSKVRDDNGNLMVMYHGTPSGDFTVFKDGTYFTENKWYADLYQNPGASSLNSRKVATNPKTFEVYLDIKKPFDINDAEARDVYINDYIKGGNAVGINPYLSDAEYEKIDSIDWTEGEDLRDFLIENGYDYDGLVLDEGATGGYGDDVKYRGKSYVVFSPEQIKNVDNPNPTKDPDIRFSVSMPVEETKELMAIHNLHTNEVLKQLDMGGLVYPSVAITDPSKIAHGDFGEVSLILKKDAIDPKNSKYNKIYSTDAYTPTFPHISYEANRVAADNVARRVNAHFAELHDYYQRSLRSLRDNTNLNDVLNRNGGYDGMISNFIDDYGMKQLYLAEKGAAVPMVVDRTETEISDVQKRMYQSVVDRLGADEINAFNNRGYHQTLADARMEWLQKNLDDLKDVITDDWASDGTMTKSEAMEIADEQKKFYWYKEAHAVYEYLQNGGVTVEEKENHNATNAKIDEKIANSDYKQWLSELFSGIEGQSGIRNSKDTFTPSGNRRSFSQLHDPVTIDNVINAMRKKDQQGEGAFGIGNIFGASAKEYGSIAEAKKNSGELGVIAKEEYDAIKERVENRLFDIAGKYSNGKDIIDAKNTLVEAVAKYETKAQIAKFLKQYDYVYKYADSIANDLISLRDYIRSLPRPYFEAKPQRAVGFDEVAVFVIPRNADIKLKQELLNRGYSIAEYDPDVEGDRQKVVNQFEEYKFSLSDASETTNKYGNFATPMSEIRYDAPTQDVAPVQVAQPDEYNSLLKEKADLERRLMQAATEGSENEAQLAEEYNALTDRIAQLEAEESTMQRNRLDSLSDADVPPEIEAPYYGESETVTPDDPFANRDIKEVGNRKVKAYMYENPEVKPFFQDEARGMLGDLRSTTKGERWYNDKLYYESNGEYGWSGTKRHTTDDIAYLLDEFGYTYAEIEKGLNAIIEDNGAENNAVSKRIEFMLDERLRKGYTGVFGEPIPANQEYINLLNEKQIMEYSDEARQNFMEHADEYAPLYTEEVIAPIAENVGQVTTKTKPVASPASGDVAPLIEDNAQTFDAAPGKGVVEGQQALWEEPDTKESKVIRAINKINRELEAEKATLTTEYNQQKESLKDKDAYISNLATSLYNEIRGLKKGVRASKQLGALLDLGYDWKSLKTALLNVKWHPNQAVNTNPDLPSSAVESIVRETLNEEYENQVHGLDEQYQSRLNKLESDAEEQRTFARKEGERETRKALHARIVEDVKSVFKADGFDFDQVLKKAKNLSTFATVDNTPQRVMEKELGYKEGQILSDLTVNKVAQNETEGIKWLNSFTDRKNGLLAEISRQYGIKPGSKKSAAAQMYAEGFYVGENNDIIKYGDAELAIDFPDVNVRENIKKLARDPRIRRIYDETLAMINESRARNGYPEIQKLDNYFLHFRAMDDTFSRLGLPFNPNDIRAKDLPTDLNGVTADLKPGQPYFASAMHRTGKRTSFDLLGGLERYLSSAKNQIYHIDDIQTLRALRNYIADTYGQANGLEGLDTLTEEEAQERIKEVYGSHLSTFAKFLNEEANVLAGKTALIDRGLEGIIGRRGITFLDTLNKQVGSNMVGYNISSSLTNFLPVVQTFAKSNKGDFVKAFAQTVSNKVGSIFGKTDGFTENSPVAIRRKGADRFHRTAWQKFADPGYALMGAVDNISTELIARTKYNELTRKGMDSQQAHYETDKWVSRLMGDRSLGQMPQLYNSKMLGLVTKFQLEVRNQLDSQFYDTIQEAKASNEDVENALTRNAKTAAKVASTFVQLAVVQHLFGKAFESVAGYNPAFDIIDAIIKTFGWDDDEESEDTVLDNIEQGFLTLLEDMPYASTFMDGGRIPISSALPIGELITGEDQYGSEKSRWETLGEIAPYYLMPGGYGQLKKTVQGLSMFSDGHPVAGSYTDSGDLRFPVEGTLANRVQAGIFGQWANENARDYFDNERSPLNEKQIQEFADVGISIQDYWKYREGLKDLAKQAEKVEYINSLDFTEEQKDVLKSYLFDEIGYAEENPEKYAFLENEGIGYLGYKQLDSETQESWSWAFNHQEEYKSLKENGVYPEDYSVYRIPMVEFDDEDNEAYMWAFENPEKSTFGKVFEGGVKEYRQYTGELYDIKADKDANGKSISGSRKEKVIDYLNDLDIDYGSRMILFKSEYPADDTYNYDIINYLEENNAISADDMRTILTELGFKVHDNGTITWD